MLHLLICRQCTSYLREGLYKLCANHCYMHYCLELDDRKLTSDLLELSLDGWHVDKHSDTRKRHLNREDLIPLMEMNHSDHMPYYEFINKMLVRKIKDEPIWELIEVDCKTPSRKLQPTPFYVGVENASIVAEVVDEASRASSPQVSYIV